MGGYIFLIGFWPSILFCDMISFRIRNLIGEIAMPEAAFLSLSCIVLLRQTMAVISILDVHSVLLSYTYGRRNLPLSII